MHARSGCGYWGHEPAAYAALLEAVYQPMKRIDPDAQVLFGGLAYDWFTSEGGPFVGVSLMACCRAAVVTMSI